MRPIKTAAALVALTLVGACASRSDLTLQPADLSGIDTARGPAPAYRDAVSLAPVSIGRDTGTPWTARFGGTQVQQALMESLLAAHLGTAQSGRFRLDATLLNLERPYASFAMTVTATIVYRLTDSLSGAVLYNQTVTTIGSASLADAITNENRLRIADERAVRANLRRLIEDLYSLPDPPRSR
ncbi:MAG: hypothetical protein U1E60_23290 [Reyranellaceae bacterium]